MSSLPSIESILLQIHQSLGLDPYSSKKKEKYRLFRTENDTYGKMTTEILDGIFRDLDLSPEDCVDAIDNLLELANFQKALELKSWTFQADERQIIWRTLGYSLTPGIARHSAFWYLSEVMDKGMPGGRFWYLPQIENNFGNRKLLMPVTQVLNWLEDLTACSQESFVTQWYESVGRSKYTLGDSVATLKKNLNNWKKKTPPNSDTIRFYFPDTLKLQYLGAFTPDPNQSSSAQFDSAIAFIDEKKLSAEKLLLEISLPKRMLEDILEGKADNDQQSLFVRRLSDRYAVPTPKLIRQRLIFARFIQDGYNRLLKTLCPTVDRLCTDPSKNKILQLCEIYARIYNLTIEAYSHCGEQGKQVEDKWFEDHLPEWDKETLYLSILPSRTDTSIEELAELNNYHFNKLIPGSDLENFVGYDYDSEAQVAKSKIDGLFTIEKEREEAQKLSRELATGSPWRTLQKTDSFQTIFNTVRIPHLRAAALPVALQRMQELSRSPAEHIKTILLELNMHLNRDSKPRDESCSKRVEVLLEEAKGSEVFKIWKAAVLQYEGKDYISLNNFERARKSFQEALNACVERNFGPLRGEIARDLFSLEVADQRLIKNNHERYFREALLFGGFEGKGTIRIEDAAREASEYFWDSLYKPYYKIEKRKLAIIKDAERFIGEAFSLIDASNWEGLQTWIESNKKNLRSSLRIVTGDTILMMWIKITISNSRILPHLSGYFPPDIYSDTRRFQRFLGNCFEAIKLLVKQVPKQLEISDFKGQTPLMLMTESGSLPIVRLMLELGANPDVQDYQGKTALTTAIACRRLDIVDALIEHSACVQKITEDGNSLLHTAIRSGCESALQKILAIEPRLSKHENDLGMTPLELAVALRDNSEALDMLSDFMKNQGKQSASISELTRSISLLADTTESN